MDLGLTVNLVLPGRIRTDRFLEHQADRASYATGTAIQVDGGLIRSNV